MTIFLNSTKDSFTICHLITFCSIIFPNNIEHILNRVQVGASAWNPSKICSDVLQFQFCGESLSIEQQPPGVTIRSLKTKWKSDILKTKQNN